MAEYFGYTKEVKGPEHVGVTSAVLVKVDGGDVKLAQSCNIKYGRQVTPHFELGSDNVYLTVGSASGTVDISRIIGVTKALEPYKGQNPCKKQTISVARGSSQCGLDIGTITMEGLLTEVGVNIDVGQFTVTDNAQYTIGSLDIN